jgi:hypothetical protein
MTAYTHMLTGPGYPIHHGLDVSIHRDTSNLMYHHPSAPSRGGGRDRACLGCAQAGELDGGTRIGAHAPTCPRHPAPRWQGGSTRPALSEPAVRGRSR